jgi:regulatory protein
LTKGVITAIERQKGRNHERFNVFVDGDFAFAVHQDVLIKHRLLKGESIDPQRLEEALRDDERQSAYLRALRYLTSRQRTVKEIERYLARHKYEPAIVEEVVIRIKEQGYIDDERFSKALAEERLAAHGKGKRWIKQELLRKGIDRTLVQETLSGIEENSELESASEIARKRWKTMSGKGDAKDGRRKLAAYLARRGYSSGVIYAAVRAATEGSVNEEGDGELEGWEWE